MMTFEALRTANIARQREWIGGEAAGLLFRALELSGEAGEAGNIVKKLERERRGWGGSRATIIDLGEELADTVICADLLALEAGIDLADATVRTFNAKSAELGFVTRIDANEGAPEIHPDRAFVEQYIGTTLANAPDLSEREKALVAGNIRAFVAVLREAKGLPDDDEICMPGATESALFNWAYGRNRGRQMMIEKTPELIDLAAGELFSAWAAGAGLNCTWQQARDMTAAAPANYPRMVNAVASARHRASALLDEILPVIGDALRRQPRDGGGQ